MLKVFSSLLSRSHAGEALLLFLVGCVFTVVLFNQFQNSRDSLMTANTASRLLSSSSLGPLHSQFEASPPPRCTYEYLKQVKGYLVDVDGTMHVPSGKVPSASAFHDWMVESGFPYVYLSDRFEGQECEAEKFNFLHLTERPLDMEWSSKHVWTAGLSLADFFIDNFADKPISVWIVTTSSPCGRDTFDNAFHILNLRLDICRKDGKCQDWNVRMDLTNKEVTEWAADAAKGKRIVYVAYAVNGLPLDDFGTHPDLPQFSELTDPVLGHDRAAYTDFYSLAMRISTLLRNKSRFLIGAPELISLGKPSEEFPELDTRTPSIGAYAEFFITAGGLAPEKESREEHFVNTGKGGNHGRFYMMDKGFLLLQKQNPTLTDSDMPYIAMVGDHLETDIVAGQTGGFMSILVLSGISTLADVCTQSIRPTCYVKDVGEIKEIMEKKIGEGQPIENWTESAIAFRKSSGEGQYSLLSDCRYYCKVNNDKCCHDADQHIAENIKGEEILPTV